MGLSYKGKICFDTALVIGYSRVPEPPAKIIPFMLPPLLFVILFYPVLVLATEDIFNP